MNYWTTKGNLIGLSKVQPNADVYLPVKLRNLLKVEPGDYVAWVLEDGDIVFRKGRWQPPTDTPTDTPIKETTK